jgi:hypothetical protein
MVAASFKCEYRRNVVDYLLNTHYYPAGRRLRRCHPRDLMSQIRNYCVYNNRQVEMKEEYFDRVVRTYFTTVLNESAQRQFTKPVPTRMASESSNTLPTALLASLSSENQFAGTSANSASTN